MISNEMAPISVVIPTMNRPDALARTLALLCGEGRQPPGQVVVVDQSREVDLQEANMSALFRYSGVVNVCYVHESIPSITRARNIGMARCVHDVLVFCDDDVDVGASTIGMVISVMADESVAMIAGLDKNAESAKRGLAGYLFGRKSFFRRQVGHVTLGMFGYLPSIVSEFATTQWAMGFFFVIRHSLVKKWGLSFDENLTSYAYAEDLDFTYAYHDHAHRAGLECIIVPNLEVTHLVSREYRIPSFEHTMMFVLHREYLSYKHFSSPLSRVATRWANLGEMFRRLVARESVSDLLRAQWYCDRNRSSVRRGQFGAFW